MNFFKSILWWHRNSVNGVNTIYAIYGRNSSNGGNSVSR